MEPSKIKLMQEKRWKTQWRELCESGNLAVIQDTVEQILTAKAEQEDDFQWGRQKEEEVIWLEEEMLNGGAFSWALMKRHWDVVRYLLIDPVLNPCRKSGLYPLKSHVEAFLMMACQEGCLDQVQWVFNDSCMTRLWNEKLSLAWFFEKSWVVSCGSGHLDVVQFLATWRPESRLWQEQIDDVRERKMGFGLMEACVEGHLKVVKYLLLEPELSSFKNSEISTWDSLIKKSFERACEFEQNEVVKWWIFECQGSMDWDSVMNDMEPYPQVKDWIRTQQEKVQLNKVFNESASDETGHVRDAKKVKKL